MRWLCMNCNNFFLIQYSNNQTKIKITCPFCKDVSVWSMAVYLHPPKKDSSKQIDYIVKDLEKDLENFNKSDSQRNNCS